MIDHGAESFHRVDRMEVKVDGRVVRYSVGESDARLRYSAKNTTTASFGRLAHARVSRTYDGLDDESRYTCAHSSSSTLPARESVIDESLVCSRADRLVAIRVPSAFLLMPLSDRHKC